MRIQHDNFSLTLLPGWESERRQSTLAVFRSVDGKGAMNISTMPSPDCRSLDQIVSVLAGKTVKIASFRTVQDGVTGVYGDCEKDQRAWRYWLLSDGHVLVVVTYNSPVAFNHDESKAVDEIVNSIRIGTQNSMSKKYV